MRFVCREKHVFSGSDYYGLTHTFLFRSEARDMHPVAYVFTIIPVKALIMYIIKEKDYTYPFIKEKWAVCRRAVLFQTSVAPSPNNDHPEDLFSVITLNPRQLSRDHVSNRDYPKVQVITL